MTANEISNVKFDKTAFGYKPDEVDDFLIQTSTYIKGLENQIEELQNKLKILASKIEEYRKDEDSLRDTLIGAQKLASSIVNEAKEKAENIVKDAEEKSKAKIDEANKIYNDIKAESEKAKIEATESLTKQVEKEKKLLSTLQREVSNFKAKLLSNYKAHIEIISTLPEIEEDKSDVQVKTDSIDQDEVIQSVEEPKQNNEVVEESKDNNISDNISAEESTQKEADKDSQTETTKNEEKKTPLNSPFKVTFKDNDLKDKQANKSKFGELKFGLNEEE